MVFVVECLVVHYGISKKKEASSLGKKLVH